VITGAPGSYKTPMMVPVPRITSDVVSPILTEDTSMVKESPVVGKGDASGQCFEGELINIEIETWEVFKKNIQEGKTSWHKRLLAQAQVKKTLPSISISDSEDASTMSASLQKNIDHVIDKLENEGTSAVTTSSDTVVTQVTTDTEAGIAGVKTGPVEDVKSESSSSGVRGSSDDVAVENDTTDTVYMSEEVT